jgi:hypothetical protein
MTKAPNRCYIGRCLSVILVAAMMVLPLMRDKLFSVNNIKDFRATMMVNQTFANRNVGLKENRLAQDGKITSQEDELQNKMDPPKNRPSHKRASSGPDSDKTGGSFSEKSFKQEESGDSSPTTDQYASENTNAMLPAVLHFPAFLDDGIEMVMELDGLQNSKGINLIKDVNASMLYPNITWIGSPIIRRLCNMEWVHQALEFYRQRNPASDMKLDWTFHLLDWSDVTHKVNRCTQLEELVGQERVHYWKRSIVAGRSWNATTRTLVLGNISTELVGVKVHPLYLATRTDIVNGIAATVANLTNQKRMTAKELTEYVVTKDRPGDVVHHWPPRGGKIDRGTPTNRNDWLRTRTSRTLRKMNKPPFNLTDAYCGLFGGGMDKGRGSTTNSFIDSLLRYKIMVVTQRDVFEGHLRLYEGLVSGALVIHDRMISIPPGLEENKNIVFFDTQEELQEKVIYYVNHREERQAIARRGRQLAMCQSRTWHRMEQIIVGKTVTPCDE